MFNCDEGIDFQSMGRIFIGLVKVHIYKGPLSPSLVFDPKQSKVQFVKTTMFYDAR